MEYRDREFMSAISIRSNEDVNNQEKKNEERLQRERIIARFERKCDEYIDAHPSPFGDAVIDYDNIKNKITTSDAVVPLFDESYVFDLAHPIKVKEDAIIGYAKKGDDIYVVKQRNLQLAKKDPYALQGNVSVETYLKGKEFHADTVLSPIDHAQTDVHETSTYEVGSMDLEMYLKQHGKILPQDMAITTMLHVIRGIHELHMAGVVHADIAPRNIILCGDRVKIADLEDSAILNGSVAKRDSIRGNRFIMPPEMLRVASNTTDVVTFGVTADIYQAAATLYNLITGKWPHVLRSFEEPKFVLNPEDPAYEVLHAERMSAYHDAHMTEPIRYPDTIAVPLRDVLVKALDPDPKKRYNGMADFGLALMKAQTQLMSV